MNNVQGVSGAKLSEYLNVSSRTIRNEVGEINRTWKEGTLILASKKTGYYIDEQHMETVRDYFLEEKKNGPEQESIDRGFTILGMVLEHGSTELFEISERMGLSESAVYKEVVRFQKRLASEYQKELITMNGDRVRICAEEAVIRQLLFRVIKNETQNGKREYYSLLKAFLSDAFEQSEYEWMIELVKAYFDDRNVQISDANLYMIASAIYITLIRREQGHHILMSSEEKELPGETQDFLAYLDSKQLNFSREDKQVLGDLLYGFKLTGNPSEKSEIASLNQLILDDFCREVMEKYQFDLWQSQGFYENVLIHIEYMMRRMETGYVVRNPILNDVKRQYPYAYEIAMLLVPIVYRYKNCFIQDDEISYIAIFIEHFLENVNQKLKVVIISSARFSMNSIIKSWIETNFQNQLEVAEMLPQHNLEQYLTRHHADLLISTGDTVIHPEIPTYKIEGLPNHYTQVAMNTLIHKIRMNYRFREIIKEHFSDQTIRIYREKVEFEQVIMDLSEDLYQIDSIYDVKEFAADVLQREENYPTYIGDWFMIPHPLVTFAKKTAIGAAVLKTPIRIKEKEIQVIFLLALERQQSEQIGVLFQFFNHIAEERSSINSLVAVNSGKELIEELIQISSSTDSH